MKKIALLLLIVSLWVGLVRTPPCAAAFSEPDLSGTWDFVYYYYGYPELVLAVITFDATGSTTSGTLSTEGYSITSGSASFTDTQTGELSGSIVSSGGITTYYTGTMNDAKNETEGTWYNNSDSGSFYMLKRPTGSQEFSISDLEGTWNITYYYTGEPTAYSGQLVFDNQGILTSGLLTTEQIILKSGGATFYDFNAGIVYCSVLWEDGPNYVVDQMVGTMNPGKDEISGQWANWLGYSGTVTLEKEEPLPTGGGGGGGGGGG